MNVENMNIEQMCYLVARLVGWEKTDQQWLENYHGMPKERYSRLNEEYHPILYKIDPEVGELILYPDTFEDHITDWEFIMKVIDAVERHGMNPNEEGKRYRVSIGTNKVSIGLNKMDAILRGENIAETEVGDEIDKRIATIHTIVKWIGETLNYENKENAKVDKEED
jgi:hypothetical protein